MYIYIHITHTHSLVYAHGLHACRYAGYFGGRVGSSRLTGTLYIIRV